MGDESEEESSEQDGESEEESSEQDGESEEGDGQEMGSPLSKLIENNGIDGGYAEMMGCEVAQSAVGSEYLIYTDEHDVIGVFEDIKFGELATDSVTSKFESKVTHMMSPIQKDIERAICARSASTHTGGFRSGKLHSASLSRLATGDDRIFRRKQINKTKDVAVSLVIDCSGSMNGEKIKLAAVSAFTLSSVLDRLGINNEVIGFTTKEFDYEVQRVMREEESKHGVSYARYEALSMPIFKRYGERMSQTVKRRLAGLKNAHDSLNSNVDGESIAIAAKRLMAQRESGKVMIVLSDGCPAVWGNGNFVDAHLKTTVEQIEASGINTVGIGIHSREVERFYSKSIYVSDIADLPTVVSKQLKAMLLGSAK